MSLLQTLGLKPPTPRPGAGAPAARRGTADTAATELRSRIVIDNQTRWPLQRIGAPKLHSPTARFEKPMPGQVAAGASAEGSIVETNAAAAGLGGVAGYRVERPDDPVNSALRWGGAAADLKLVDPRFRIMGTATAEPSGEGGRLYRFTFAEYDPQAAPATIQVTIVNDADFPLKRLGAPRLDSRSAQFRGQPAATIAAGGRSRFAVESKDPELHLTGGAVDYGFMADPADRKSAGRVLIKWHHLKSQSSAQVAPRVKGVSATVGGSDGDIVFTVSRGGFGAEPPDKISNPTLRLGDKGMDGWVEYLQQLLNEHMTAGLTVHGVFDNATLAAVHKFQLRYKDQGVLVDGVVGDQTWSYLRDAPPERPRTDGRAPHSHVETGLEARWVLDDGPCRYDAASDALVMDCVSVGDDGSIAGRPVRIVLTGPDGVGHELERRIGPGQPSSTTGEGSRHTVRVEGASKLFDGALAAGPCHVVAYFEKALGSDKVNTEVWIGPAAR